MPELPDVEGFRRYLDATAMRKCIDRAEPLDQEMLRGRTPRSLQMRLKGRRLVESLRHGKFLFARLDDDRFLVLHFGMTGRLDYAKDDGSPPDHARAILHLENGYRLAYICPRRLGLYAVVDDMATFVNQRQLGPDALDEQLDARRFGVLLEGRRGAVKSTLMNQNILAGIGNIWADEILFQAGVDPGRAVDKLDDSERQSVFRAMRRILKRGARAAGDVSKLPRSYLLSHRQGDRRCPRCGGDLQSKRISGRTSTFCSRCQK